MEKIPKLQKLMAEGYPRPDYVPRAQVLAPAFKEPVPPEPFKFLAQGLWLNVRPEKRGRGLYWMVNKQHNGKRHNIYICPVGALTRSKLEDAARKITE